MEPVNFEQVLLSCLSVDNQVREGCSYMASASVLTVLGLLLQVLILQSVWAVQVRKNAEDAIKALSSHPQILTELVRKVQEAQDPQVRHLAAVLLRKRIDRHWGQQTAEVCSWMVSFCGSNGVARYFLVI